MALIRERISLWGVWDCLFLKYFSYLQLYQSFFTSMPFNEGEGQGFVDVVAIPFI